MQSRVSTVKEQTNTTLDKHRQGEELRRHFVYGFTWRLFGRVLRVTTDMALEPHLEVDRCSLNLTESENQLPRQSHGDQVGVAQCSIHSSLPAKGQR